MKNRFVVWIAAKWFVVVVALCVSFNAWSTPIVQPGSTEASLAPEWNEWPESLDGSLKSCKSEPEEWINVFRPSWSIGIDGAKLSKNGRTECGTRSNATGSVLSMDSKSVVKPLAEPLGKNSDEQQRNNADCPFLCFGEIGKPEDHWLFWFFVGGLIIVAMPAARTMKPNV